MANDPEKTNWLSHVDQLEWFNTYKVSNSNHVKGLSYEKFQDFLKDTIGASTDNLLRREGAICQGDMKQQLYLTTQEEAKLFKIFDLDNDMVISQDEFNQLCEQWIHKYYQRNSALVIVDVQNDFIDGSLALLNGPARQDGAEVVEVINKIIDTWIFDGVVYTQDWHPPDHIGFYDNLHLRKYCVKLDENDNKLLTNGSSKVRGQSKSDPYQDYKYSKTNQAPKLYDIVLFDDGKLEQKLWPIHCVQNSWGAELHPQLKIVPDAIRILKGTMSNIDAYSAFWDNSRLNETSLKQKLVMRNIDDVFVCGLALDYCVASTALDSAAAGFKTYVIEDACRGIDHRDMASKRKEFQQHGIIMIDSKTTNYNIAKALRSIVWTRDFLSNKTSNLTHL